MISEKVRPTPDDAVELPALLISGLGSQNLSIGGSLYFEAPRIVAGAVSLRRQRYRWQRSSRIGSGGHAALRAAMHLPATAHPPYRRCPFGERQIGRFGGDPGCPVCQ